MGNMKGTEKLAATLQKRMKKTTGFEATEYLELGKITSNMGLKLDNFSETIPKGDYLVCKSLRFGTIKTNDGDDSVTLPGLKSGSRVLVGWASGEPVVIDIVV